MALRAMKTQEESQRYRLDSIQNNYARNGRSEECPQYRSKGFIQCRSAEQLFADMQE